MDRISWMVMAIIEIVLFLMLAKAIYGDAIKIEKNKILFFSFVVIIFFIIENIYQIHIAYFLILFAVILFSNAKISKRILNTLTVLIIGMGIQEFVTLALTSYSLTVFDTAIKTGDIYYFIAMLVVSKIIEHLRVDVGIDWSEVPSYIYINTVLGFCAGILPLDLVRMINTVLPSNIKILMILISYVAIACTILSIYLYVKNYQEKNKYSQESQLKSDLLKMQTQYFENTMSNYSYLRKFRHDIRGHLRTLNVLCTDNPKALSYIQKMTNIVEENRSFTCNNTTIGALLNSFINELDECKIKHKIHYYVNGTILLDDIDLCSLLYNLTNNALEAEKKLDKADKMIEIEIINHDTFLLIKITNDVDENFDMRYIKNKETTKLDKNNHGIGLKNIYEVSKKYKGDVDYILKNNRLRAEIVLQNAVFMDKNNLVNER